MHDQSGHEVKLCLHFVAASCKQCKGPDMGLGRFCSALPYPGIMLLQLKECIVNFLFYWRKSEVLVDVDVHDATAVCTHPTAYLTCCCQCRRWKLGCFGWLDWQRTQQAPPASSPAA